MRFNWLDELQRLFVAPAEPTRRALRDITKFGIGVCPGCRGLRGTASLRCSHCGSAAPVTDDA